MFRPKKLTRNFAPGSLFRPVQHSRQFLITVMTVGGVAVITACGLAVHHSIDAHIMPVDKPQQTSSIQEPATRAVAQDSVTREPVSASNQLSPVSSHVQVSQPSSVRGSTAAIQATRSTDTVRKTTKTAIPSTTAGSTPEVSHASLHLDTLGVHGGTDVTVPL